MLSLVFSRGSCCLVPQKFQRSYDFQLFQCSWATVVLSLTMIDCSTLWLFTRQCAFLVFIMLLLYSISKPRRCQNISTLKLFTSHCCAVSSFSSNILSFDKWLHWCVLFCLQIIHWIKRSIHHRQSLFQHKTFLSRSTGNIVFLIYASLPRFLR